MAGKLSVLLRKRVLSRRCRAQSRPTPSQTWSQREEPSPFLASGPKRRKRAPLLLYKEPALCAKMATKTLRARCSFSLLAATARALSLSLSLSLAPAEVWGSIHFEPREARPNAVAHCRDVQQVDDQGNQPGFKPHVAFPSSNDPGMVYGGVPNKPRAQLNGTGSFLDNRRFQVGSMLQPQGPANGGPTSPKPAYSPRSSDASQPATICHPNPTSEETHQQTNQPNMHPVPGPEYGLPAGHRPDNTPTRPQQHPGSAPGESLNRIVSYAYEF